ncbi:putative ATP-binding cassette transporter [Nemania abortiva]|nr:putative ATP-binding cassette transporter [Nemania abortiva]
MACTFEAESSFGPSVAPCRRPFDFTLTFEEVFLQLLPSSVFILAALVRLIALARCKPCVRLGLLYALKIGTATIFLILKLVLLVYTSVNHHGRTSISIPAASVGFVATLSLAVLSHFEHVQSSRPSYLLEIYLTITSVLTSATVRTYWLLEDGFNVTASISLTALLIQIALLALESCSKRRWLMGEKYGLGGISVEESASFLNHSLFAWLNRLLLSGYRRELREADLIGLMDNSLGSKESEDNFSRVGKIRKYSGSGYSLCLLSIRSLGFYAFAPFVPRLSMSAFIFAQPFLATSLIQYLNDENPSKNNGYGLIGAAFLVYTGIAVSTAWYTHLNYKCAAKIRAGLLDAISHKLLRIVPEKGSESKVLTLMVNDVQRIAMNMPYVYDLAVVPIEVGIGLWLLYRQVGPSSLTVLGLAIVCLTISLTIGKYSAQQQRVWLAATEARISATKNMLSSLKAIKMTGFDAKAASAIEKLRATEFAASKMFRKLLVGGVFTAYSTSTLAPVLVFGAYVGVTESQKQGIDAAKLFGSLILISLVSSPLIYVLQYIPSLGAMLGCYGRLEAFFEKEDKSDARKLLRDSAVQSPELSSTSTTPGDVTPESDRLSAAETTDGDPILSIRHGSFGWSDQTLLKDIDLDVSAGQHVVITGPVGCGKSLLLQAILGELEPRSGEIVLHDTSLAYCGQVPWLENATARSNALRCAPTNDDSWHRRVIEACALRQFLDSQESTKTIGSNGASISGGERQRLALARAVALRPRILVLDDVFSALDKLTKTHILERLFGPTGLLSEIGTTVIQVTQDANCARFADQTFQIEDYDLKPYDFPIITTSGTEENGKTIKYEDEPPTKEERPISRQTEKEDLLPNPALARDRQDYQMYFNSIGRKNLVIFIALTATASFLVKFPDIWAQFWATDSTRPGGPLHSTQYWIGIYVALGILPLIFLSCWIGHLLLTIVPKSGVGLHSKILNAVLRVTFVFISRIDTGDLINRFSQDLMLVDVKLPLDLANTAFYVFTIIINITLVAVAAIYVLSAIPVIIVVLFVVQRFYLRTSKQLRQLDLQSKAGLQSKASEIYAGLPTIRAHGWQSVAVEEIREKIDRTQEPHYLLWMVQTWLKLVLQLTVAGIAITVTGVAVATRTVTSGSAIGLAFLNLTNLGEALTVLISMWTSLETSLGAVARIESFEANTPAEKAVESPIEVPAEWPQSREIVFRNVHSTYNAASEKPRWSLEDINLRINAGEKIAVCGQSGSGKSTLLLSLLALVDTPSGTISVDGVGISRVPQSLLRSRFHVISQDTFVQNEGVRQSLNPDSALSDEAINEVLEECAILEKVNAGGGLSASLGDISFSVGEAQLFVLARTILQAGNRPGGVVLLDEVTSSIDTRTEQRIMKLMADKLRGKTIISVLHRLEVALLYDRILVLENGRVAHFGTPDEIIRESALFASFRNTTSRLDDMGC